MKQVRALLGILSVVLVLGIGVGFAVGWYISGADADAYRNAPPCQNSQDTSACYVAVPATIGSVHVQYSRSGEYDEVSLVLGGVARAVTLKPSTVSASSVRSGAQGSATLYKGEVMSLEVGSYSIPSDKNPIANHGSYGFYALTLLGLGCLLAGGRYLVPYWRRSRAAESSSTSSALTAGRGIVGNQSVVRGNENLADPGAIQTLITPTGIVQAVKPRFSAGPVLTAGFGGLLLVVYSLRALSSPLVGAWVLLADALLLGVGLLALVLFWRNSAMFFDESSVGRIGILGQRTVVSRSDIAYIAKRAVSTRGGTQRYLIFVGSSGRCLIRVGGKWWPSDDLDRWAAATRIRIDGNWDQTTGYTTMSRDFPGSINWTGQIIFVVIALILIVGFVAVMPSSR